jgi:fructokinase
MRLQADELDRELLQNARAFHFGSLSLIQEPSRSATLEAVKIAKDGGALISFDVNYRADLWSEAEACERVMATIPHVDLLKINEIELRLLGSSNNVDAVSKALLAKGPDLVVVTLGPDGSYFRIVEGSEASPPFNVNTVDATGCGDAFIAGLLCRLVKDDDWQEQLTMERMRQNLRYANAVGALTALTLGVVPALPTAARVEEFLAQQD